MINYSSLNASIGLILMALCAGISPINVPKVTNAATAPSAMVVFTVGFTNGIPSPSVRVALIIINIPPANMIPRIPATRVKNTDSKII